MLGLISFMFASSCRELFRNIFLRLTLARAICWLWINRPLGIETERFTFGDPAEHLHPQQPLDYITRQAQGDWVHHGSARRVTSGRKAGMGDDASRLVLRLRSA